MTLKKIYLFIILSSLLFTSCEKWLVDSPAPYPPSAARFLLYLYSTSSAPPDIVFTISEIKLQTEDNRWIKLLDGPIDISSTALIDRQILLKDASVEPGVYKGLKLIIAKASVHGRDGQVSLALPQPDGEVVIESNIRLQRKESFVASLVWNPEKSFAKGHQFQPSSALVEYF